MAPPPEKRAREDEATPLRPSIIKYTGPSNPHIGYSRPTLPAQAAAQSTKERNAASPSALHHALPGPSRAAPPTQGQEVALQHAMPGPSGTQVQSEYKNVSISTWL